MNKKILILFTALSLSAPLISMDASQEEAAKELARKLSENSEQIKEAARRLTESGAASQLSEKIGEAVRGIFFWWSGTARY